MTMYLIIKETTFKGFDSIYEVCNFTNNIDKANDMLQGYRMINENKNISFSILKYEPPLILTEEVA